MGVKTIYDVVERMEMRTLVGALMKNGSRQAASAIQDYLPESGKAGRNILFYNYGRQALYSLFKHRFSGQGVMFPAFICPGVVAAAVNAGVRPRLMDVSLEDFNLDPGLVSDRDIGENGAIFINHTFGVPADIDAIRLRFGGRAYIIEDVAQALFARHGGRYVGALGDSVLASVYKQTPNINVAVLLTDCELGQPERGSMGAGNLTRLLWLTSGPQGYLVRLLRRRRSIAGPPEEDRRLPQAHQPSPVALRLFAASLPGLEGEIAGRRTVAQYYRARAEASPYLIPQRVSPSDEPSWFNFSVRLAPEIAHIRDALLTALRRQGIFCDRLWHDAPAAAGAFKDYLNGDCPNARLLAESVVNLPIKAAYTATDIEYLFDRVEQAIGRLV